jgi:hypothetical protein
MMALHLFMIRTQIQLTEAQIRNLRRVAREQGISLAETIRRLIDQGIEEAMPDRGALYSRASTVIGAFRDDGASDVSEKHDEYLDGAYE